MMIRTATAEDIAQVQTVYAHHVLAGLASFEEVPPSVEEMRARYAEVRARGLPYLVAHQAGTVLGYGYCSLYRTRSAYRHTLEDSIYIRQGSQGKGIGRSLLAELIRACDGLGYRQLVAVIGDSGNAASIGLHASLGFVRAGTLRSVGYKLGRWVDSVFMQRPLGPGDSARPGEPTPS